MSMGETSLKTHFAEAFRQITKRQVSPEIHVAFYPFAGLNHTIRVRRQKVYVRVSDILKDAPPQVCRALAFILVSKLFKKEVIEEYERMYRQYAYQPSVLRASDLARQKRGRKILTGTIGRVYNLDKMFAKINRRYFANDLSKPTLSWSVRRTKRILGHHDYVHDTIVISRSLDATNIPEYVVEYVLFHEMLHMKHRPRVVNGRRIYHTAAFRADERRFAKFEEAIHELEKWTQKKS